jgi:hypothetical protein
MKRRMYRSHDITLHDATSRSGIHQRDITESYTDSKLEGRVQAPFLV